jgi:hypothetical protein
MTAYCQYYMKRPKHTQGGATLTELVLELFRLNGRVLSAGDQLTKDIGLSRLEAYPSSTIVSPHLFKRVAVPGICIA